LKEGELAHRIVHFLVNLFAWLACRLRVVGRENIPAQGPFIVVTNHLGAADPPIIFGLIPQRLGLTGMAAMEHRHDFLIGWLMEKGGAIWVRRGESDREALRESLDALARGRPLGVAPEGTRSDTGALIEGKAGITFLALKADVPLVPVALSGSERVFRELRRLRRARVNVRIGPVFCLPERGSETRKEHMQYCTDLIMTRLASLLPERYRGFYAGHALIGYWEALDAAGESRQPGIKMELLPQANGQSNGSIRC
jgi:1-acyl-sn-glycerol-3-phosphate acyltransferase